MYLLLAFSLSLSHLLALASSRHSWIYGVPIGRRLPSRARVIACVLPACLPVLRIRGRVGAREGGGRTNRTARKHPMIAIKKHQPGTDGACHTQAPQHAKASARRARARALLVAATRRSPYTQTHAYTVVSRRAGIYTHSFSPSLSLYLSHSTYSSSLLPPLVIYRCIVVHTLLLGSCRCVIVVVVVVVACV